MCFLVTRFSLSKIMVLIEIFLRPNHIKSVSSRSLFPVLMRSTTLLLFEIDSTLNWSQIKTKSCHRRGLHDIYVSSLALMANCDTNVLKLSI